MANTIRYSTTRQMFRSSHSSSKFTMPLRPNIGMLRVISHIAGASKVVLAAGVGAAGVGALAGTRFELSLFSSRVECSFSKPPI